LAAAKIGREMDHDKDVAAMNVAVFLPNWIGDVVMAGPALRALRSHFGKQATLLGVMRPYVADVLEGTNWLDEQLFYDPKSRDAALHGWPLVRRLRAQRLDLAVLLTNSLRTGLLAWFAGARRRVGYVRYGRGMLLTDRLQPPSADGQRINHPMVDYYLKLASAVGCPEESPQLELSTTVADERAADLIWKKFKLRPASRVVVFNSSGAFGAAKLWPPEHFAELARIVATRLDHDVLVICGPSERQIAADVVRRAAHPLVVSLADEPLSIGLSKSCIRRSRLLVTTDSGPRHFAVAFGVPVIGLYGPTSPIWGENPTAKGVDLHLELECFACMQRVCPLGHHRCMQELSPERVFQAVAAELAPQRESTAA
jgi:heptosyltransferase-2